MESFFRLPSKDSHPLQGLSSEQVNTHTSSTAHTSKTGDAEPAYPPMTRSSAHSSPTKQKGSLFADYHPIPGTPSNKVSGFALAQSPSLPEIHALRAGAHVRTNSDVQGLVKRFEYLDVRDRDAESVERRKKHEAELRRAQIAREEAESDVKRMREQLRALKKENEDGQDRERRVARRLEIVMDEYAQIKQTHASQTSVYDKEVRKARKEAFKSSSHLLKIQAELKSTRQSLRITQSGLELEKQKAQRREQETFEAHYRLIAVQEELEKLKQTLKVVEEEKDTLKKRLGEEEVAVVAAEGGIALPTSHHDDGDCLSSPRKQSPRKQRQLSPLSDDKENLHSEPKKQIETRRLQEHLTRERLKRKQAEEMLEFMTMECKFRCCTCRTASRLGHEHALSIPGDLAESLDVIRNGMKGVLRLPGHLDDVESMQVDVGPGVRTNSLEGVQAVDVEITSEQRVVEETAVEDDRSVTMVPEEPIEASPEAQLMIEQMKAQDEAQLPPHPSPVDTPPATQQEVADTQQTTTIPLQPSSPRTPAQPHHTTPFRHQPSIRTVTTTTRIPLHFTPVAKSKTLLDPITDIENIPPPQVDDTPAVPAFDRAAALAAIEYRRGRAKSFAQGQLTPRKQMVDLKDRRDISAPALGGKIVGGVLEGSGKSGGSVGRAAGRRMV